MNSPEGVFSSVLDAGLMDRFLFFQGKKAEAKKAAAEEEKQNASGHGHVKPYFRCRLQRAAQM